MNLRATAAALFGAAAVLAGCGASTPTDTTGADVAANLKTVAGLPQDGSTLGSPDAQYTLTVFDSLDSFNRGFFLSDLPALVSQYVRAGRLNVVAQTVTGFDSGQSDDTGASDAARYAQAAGLQDHLWDFYGALSARYIGTIDPGVLDAALGDVPGVDVARATSDAKGTQARRAIDAANKLAAADGASDLPYYTLTKGSSGTPVPVDGSCQGCLVRGVTRVLSGQGPQVSPTPTPAAVPRKEGRRNGRTIGNAVPAPTATPTVTPSTTP